MKANSTRYKVSMINTGFMILSTKLKTYRPLCLPYDMYIADSRNIANALQICKQLFMFYYSVASLLYMICKTYRACMPSCFHLYNI